MYYETSVALQLIHVYLHSKVLYDSSIIFFAVNEQVHNWVQSIVQSRVQVCRCPYFIQENSQPTHIEVNKTLIILDLGLLYFISLPMVYTNVLEHALAVEGYNFII